MGIEDKEIFQVKDELNLLEEVQEVENLYKKVVSHIDHARASIHRVVDTEMVNAYFNIGRDIVEEEQQGQKRAEYGSLVLQALSKRLTQKYGRGEVVPFV